jgi:outer membrane biosynthesis protein TonB
VATIFRIYTLYKPLKTFFAIGSLLLALGTILGVRFLWHFAEGDRAGHIQSLILAAVFLIVGFQTMLIGLVADLISVNRRLSEEVLIRLRRLEAPAATPAPARPREAREPRPQREPRDPQAPPAPRRERPAAAEKPTAKPATPPTNWVWLVDDDKLQNRGIQTAAEPAPPAEPSAPAAPAADETNGESTSSKRRRRRRGGVRQHADLPGNRGKHLAGNGEKNE